MHKTLGWIAALGLTAGAALAAGLPPTHAMYPSREAMLKPVIGTVTHVDLPGNEVTVKIGQRIVGYELAPGATVQKVSNPSESLTLSDIRDGELVVLHPAGVPTSQGKGRPMLRKVSKVEQLDLDDAEGTVSAVDVQAGKLTLDQGQNRQTFAVGHDALLLSVGLWERAIQLHNVKVGNKVALYYRDQDGTKSVFGLLRQH